LWILVSQPIDQQDQIVPVVMSARMAQDEGRATRPDRLPLEVGATGSVELPLPGSKTTLLNYRIVGITRSFPSLAITSTI
jgi:hypothetical protein